MRPFFFLLFIAAVFSCSNKPAIESAISDHMKSLANDPNSFEYVETIYVDTITKGENLSGRIEYLERTIADNVRSGLDTVLSSHPRLVSLLDSTRQRITSEDTSLIDHYKVACRIRAKNKMGALVLEEHHVIVSSDFLEVKLSD